MAVETKERKKKLIEESIAQFQKLNEGNKMFVLGYMLGIQQEKLKEKAKPQAV